jgi:hypothetical protein
VWFELQLEDVRTRLAQALTARELISQVLKLTESVQRRVVIFMYLWWTERCRIREEKIAREPRQMAQLINNYTEEWASLKKERAVTIPSRRTRSWSKPSPGFVKINCDGAFFQEQLVGG